MSLINIQNLSFGYDGSAENVFENVDLQIDTSWRLGLTGRNGRGKTTLLKLLMGEEAYTGSIASSVDFEYFPYTPEGAYLTIDVIDEIAPGAEEWQIRRELNLLEADDGLMYRPFCSLSDGERTKALITGMFLRENSFLLIDEPTNHLDTHAREVLAVYLKKKSGFILVSHDRDFLDACIDHILVINKMNIEVQKGNFSSWNENRENRERFELAENERLKKEISQLERATKRSATWSNKTEVAKHGTRNSGLRPDRGYIGHKAAKLMKRAKAMESRIEKDISEKSALLRNVDEGYALKLTPLKFRASKLMEVNNASLSYDGEVVFKNVSFTIDRGDRIAVCGRNGSGKTSLIKMLTGELDAQSGTISAASGLKISYVRQSSDDMGGELGDYIGEYQIDEALFKAILCKMGFSSELFTRNIADYSQGEKKKVMLARSLSEKAHLYIWDEPLNYIDVISRIQIEALLKGSSVTMIFVEHDARFCDRIANKRINLSDSGGYDRSR
ncbi:MAG: ABC-F type ribosomal protection protein [Bacteroides sp.]|nr:ABC-F type ribosomal protection protein [Eubacterium sp.]MCM1418240.1 ABC-F type ribosomal protection protein [Roseburia sp.]MCM1462378.1 ABC-F type ribosomal protection protein [Bacteroides sp.]